MGRPKAVPAKLNNSGDQWNLQKVLDYIPVKRRKNKVKRKGGHVITTVSENSRMFHLGELCIGNTDNVLPENWTSCRASFSSFDEGDENLILEFDSCCVVINTLLDKAILKEIIASKVFSFTIFGVSDQVYFNIYFVYLPLPKFHKSLGSCIQTIFTLLYNISAENTGDSNKSNAETKPQEITELYKNIKKCREKQLQLGNENVQHPRLKPQLRPYQESAVRWMLCRERNSFKEKDMMHPLYTKVKLKSGLEIYYDKYTGYVDLCMPTVDKPSLGGILADEMGLGKTVEVLACILLNSNKNSTEQSGSQDTINEFDNNESPTVEKVSKKRKISDDKAHTASDLVDKPKKLKVPNDWVKSSSKKSQTWKALEMWYNNCLMEVQVKEKTFKENPTLQCICGSTSQKGTVTCVDCNKVQHGECLGYTRSLHGKYRCPQCWMNQPLLDCGATLIVTPTSLRTQWCNEICKHVKGDFKVLQYGNSSCKPIYPTEFLRYDVIVTTYNVLQSELRLTETEKVVSFRHQRRYSPPGSPLTRVKWWRLCLDEAQAVEAPSSMVSAMAQKLTAHFRWAITGTPISKEISDIYGLVEYLHMEPYNDKTTWKHLLFDPYINGNIEPMCKFLSQVLWRSAKDDIFDQINIPSQTICNHWLQFSAVEQYFYKCEHQSSRESFLERIGKYDLDTSLQSINKSSLKAVLAPLLSLRHVCTYPNTVRTRYLATKKPVNSMKDLLDALIVKNTVESEEYLRVILCSLNGLAGIYLLLQNPYEAIRQYREVLQLYTRFTEEEKVDKLTVDKLQIIHTLHNLAETLDVCPDLTERTLRDETLRKDCEEIEKKYIGKFINQSMTALQDSLVLTKAVLKLQESFVLESGKWYNDILNWIYLHDYAQELLTRIENAHSTANVECAINVKNKRDLLYLIATWEESISDLREAAIQVVNSLYTHCPDDEFQIIIAQNIVQEATDCHLRPQKKKKPKQKCPICVANDGLKAYELKLFCMTKRTKTYVDMSLQGSWKPTTEELIFRSILALARSKCTDRDLVKDGETHINLLETLKKEFKEIRKLWTFLNQQICAQDELDMCKIRLRLKDPNEERSEAPKVKTILKNLTYNLENKLETIHVLGEHELDYQRSSLLNEERQNRIHLEKHLGIRSYLETLHKQQYEGQNPDPCPICKNNLEQHYSIIPCGHSYCLECIEILIKQTKKLQVQCSVCRAYHFVKDISYIKQGYQENDEDNLEIKGNYSTKVEGLIKLLLELKNDDPNVKVLVFSSWTTVLKYIRDALEKNDIKVELAVSSTLEKQIEKFKELQQGVTTLLLPVNLGSKGLNLIEATHLVLIEPLLNPGDELQAISRIHRIGQTKPTFVHKFFINNTIEESIQKATSMNAQDWDKNKVTLRQVMELFVSTEENNEDTTNSIID